MKKTFSTVIFATFLFVNTSSAGTNYLTNSYYDKMIESFKQYFPGYVKEYISPDSNQNLQADFANIKNHLIGKGPTPHQQQDITRQEDYRKSIPANYNDNQDPNPYLEPTKYSNKYLENDTDKINQQVSTTDSLLANIPKECGVINGDDKRALGCGKATTFGHNTKGGQDSSPDDGNVFCNTKNGKSDPNLYTYRDDRSKADNLKNCFAALRIKDIRKIFKISGSLEKNRSMFCGKKFTVVNTANKMSTEVTLMDQMNNNDKVIDLTGACMLKLGAKGLEPTLSKVIVVWNDSSSNNIQVADIPTKSI